MVIVEKKNQKMSFWAHLIRFISEFTTKQVGIVLLVGVICAALGYSATITFVKPIYASTVTIAVMNEPGEKVSNIQNLSVCYHIADTLAVTGRNYQAAENTIERLKLDMAPKQLLGKIRVARREKTMLVRVRAIDNDPELANQIVQVYSEELLAELGDTLFIHKPIQIYGPVVSSSIGGVKENTLLSAFLGCFLTACVFYRRHRSERTIKEAKDLESFQKSIIGEIMMVQASMSARRGGAA